MIHFNTVEGTDTDVMTGTERASQQNIDTENDRGA